MIIMMIQWHAHYIMNAVSTYFDTIPIMILALLFVYCYLSTINE